MVFGNQGDLYLNAMTWWDHDTGSVWSQPLGRAILGPLEGQGLELLSSRMTTWDDWQDTWPDTTALAVESRETFDYLDVAGIVVEIGPDSLIVPIRLLRNIGVVNEVVNDVPVAVVLSRGDNKWTVFSRETPDGVVELMLEDGILVDTVTGNEFDPVRGLALGEWDALSLLPGFTAFPSDYERLFPDGRTWSP